ncbi:hypothetical protein JOE26_003284 [Rhodococcus coprophilus]|uniref:Uncharacterized protein n=1 Tax=Rhodococcus coprophilus TaxID=38310 RepID=A0A2X4TLK8_9NOCA|nr:hypothetical protein [Rhodococcus coprophilus]SQI28417.1 Uncharacterised protein [Rhodococcus coprophilus]
MEQLEHPFDRFAASYGPIKCVPKNGGDPLYLGASAANYIPLVANAGDGTKCMWMRDARGELWLSASLTVYRYMGWAEQDYADWGLGQAPGVGKYSQPLLFNSDGTVSLASQPVQQLYNDDGWAKWGVGREDALVITPAP